MKNTENTLCRTICSECGAEIECNEKCVSVVFSLESTNNNITSVYDSIQLKCYCLNCAQKLNFDSLEIPHFGEDKLHFETI